MSSNDTGCTIGIKHKKYFIHCFFINDILTGLYLRLYDVKLR